MKLNFPSTLTQEKMLTIFLVTFLQSNGVKAGRNFMNCLNGISSITTNPYNNLVNFVTTRNWVNGQEFCCDDDDFDNCRTNFSDCDRRFDIQGQCQKFGQENFCLISSDNLNPSENANLPSDLCGGILGEVSLTESVNGNCASLETVRISLNKTCHTQNLAWLCCRDNDCSLPNNVKIDTETWTANTSCPLNYYSLICLSDSRVWTCTGDTSKNGTHSLKIGSCSFQLSNLSSMKINASGLPTPWPIAAISVIVSIVSIFSFNIERDSVNWFGKSILSFNILRSGAGLVGSINSLRVNMV